MYSGYIDYEAIAEYLEDRDSNERNEWDVYEED